MHICKEDLRMTATKKQLVTMSNHDIGNYFYSLIMHAKTKQSKDGLVYDNDAEHINIPEIVYYITHHAILDQTPIGTEE